MQTWSHSPAFPAPSHEVAGLFPAPSHEVAGLFPAPHSPLSSVVVVPRRVVIPCSATVYCIPRYSGARTQQPANFDYGPRRGTNSPAVRISPLGSRQRCTEQPKRASNGRVRQPPPPPPILSWQLGSQLPSYCHDSSEANFPHIVLAARKPAPRVLPWQLGSEMPKWERAQIVVRTVRLNNDNYI